MSHGTSALAAFHLIGDRTGLDPDHEIQERLRPALFGSYGDLSSIRYDYPLVLLHEADEGAWVRSLADITDDALKIIADSGVSGETTRRQVLSLEQTIRTLLANGERGSFSSLWKTASRQMTAVAGDASESMNALFQRTLDTIGLDGELLDCDRELAGKILAHAWQESERLKAENLLERVGQLAQKLADILQVDYMHSPEACSADKLESSMGSANQSVFDFRAMARVLRSVPAAEALPANRKRRIQSAISILKSQRFVAAASEIATADETKQTYHFCFDDCNVALAEYRERLPAMAALVRAISIAQLEIDNRYRESQHEDYFDAFDENCLGPADVALFPSYLVSLENVTETDKTAILKILRAGLPFKVMAQTNDILDADSMAKERLSFGIRGQQLARMAIGLEQVFVFQAASSSLYHLRNSIMLGLSIDRPALFSIYSGAGEDPARAANESSSRKESTLPPYLVAASATESRAFPAFVYNPAAGSGQKSRFHLQGNPEPANDWPEHQLSFEDSQHGRQSEDLLFTLLDFVAADSRYAQRFICVPPQDWTDEMVPAGEFLGLNDRQRTSRVPYLLLLDPEDKLHRAVVDERLVEAAERCRDSWHSLQELAGINNSHSKAALALAQQAWEAEKEQLISSQLSENREPTPPSGPEVVAESLKEEAIEEVTGPIPEEPSSRDDPWIETIRCTSCNECTQLNDRMFAYDDDMRAYVADSDAGTYRELVEAAESCQVAIIHPGMPRNPDEPDLEELIERAQPFN